MTCIEALFPYLLLLAVSFAAATIFPAQSEALLFGMLVQGSHSPLLLLAVASVGNIAGSCLNWLIGTRIVTLKTNRWVPIKRERLDKAKSWYARYGRFSLLLSWLPVIGDPLTLVAGVMREPFASFLVLVAAAKTARYVVVYLLHIGFFT